MNRFTLLKKMKKIIPFKNGGQNNLSPKFAYLRLGQKRKLLYWRNGLNKNRLGR